MAMGSGQPPGRQKDASRPGRQPGRWNANSQGQGQAFVTTTLLFLSLGTSLCPRSSNHSWRGEARAPGERKGGEWLWGSTRELHS